MKVGLSNRESRFPLWYFIKLHNLYTLIASMNTYRRIAFRFAKARASFIEAVHSPDRCFAKSNGRAVRGKS